MNDPTDASVQALIEQWAGTYRGSDSQYDTLVEALLDERDRLRFEGRMLEKAGDDLAANAYELSCGHAQHCPCRSAEHRAQQCRVRTMNESRTRWGNVTAALNAPSEASDE